MNGLCQRLGIRIPIIQAPMGSVAGPELCRAVSETGALGSMGLTWTTLDDAIRKVEAMKGLPFLANYVLHFDPITLPAVVEAGAPIIGFSWGDPAPYFDGLRAKGVKIAIQAGSVEGIRSFARMEPDFLILQGREAGGHVQSHSPLVDMIEAAVEAARNIPLAVAGGLATGADVAKSLKLGAQAAVLGTRFIATQEAEAHPEYKSALIEANEGQTVMTTCFDGEWPYAQHRVLRNSTFQNWEDVGCPPIGSRPGEGDVVAQSALGDPIPRYHSAAPRSETMGNIEAMCLYAGTGVNEIADAPPAAELVKRIWQEASRNL